MSKIKFRVWDSEKKVWITDYIGINNHGVIVNNRDDMYNLSLHDSAIISYSTGESDINGKEIYEGDILGWSESGEGWGDADIYGIYIVEWSDDKLRYVLYDPYSNEYRDMYDSNFESIQGNIFENPIQFPDDERE